MALPFVRQVLSEIPDADLDNLVEQLLAAYASLRADEAPGVVILRRIDVPDGVPNMRYIEPLWDNDFNVERFIAGATGSVLVEFGEPLSVPSALDWP